MILTLLTLRKPVICIGAAYKSFPKGTVHLIGVDAELNKENQHIAISGTINFLLC
jgi:hypothetical protein